jgi:pimeloyl-ACP methyl ester carboxylesterase
MRGLVALVVVTLVLVFSSTPAVTAEVSPPKQCGRATLVTADGATGVGGSPKPHGDGYYTPVLMVHGWNGHPDMWWSDSDRTAQPGQKVSPGHSVASDVQRLRGAAVYTLDYHAVADRWFTQQGAGGQWFLDAARCLMDDKAFARHKMVVVAHSMGGLITRWAVTSDERIRAGTSLVLTLGTPYDGSWLATVGLVLLDAADVASRLDPRLARLRSAVHLLMLGCQANGKVPGCTELTKFLREIESVRAFAFGSNEYAELKPWPSGIAVKTLTGRVLLENAAAEMFLSVPVPGDVDFGDGVVDVGSATNGRTLAVESAATPQADCGRTSTVCSPSFISRTERTRAPTNHWSKRCSGVRRPHVGISARAGSSSSPNRSSTRSPSS